MFASTSQPLAMSEFDEKLCSDTALPVWCSTGVDDEILREVAIVIAELLLMSPWPYCGV